jgi:uncharacterized membrane protein YgcG
MGRALDAAQEQSGVRFSVRVGEVDGDVPLFAEITLSKLVERPRDPAVLILVSPGQRLVHVMTTLGARRRISDQSAGLAVLTMTSSFSLGDLVGGIINGLRQLADAAGPASPAPRTVAAIPPARAH